MGGVSQCYKAHDKSQTVNEDAGSTAFSTDPCHRVAPVGSACGEQAAGLSSVFTARGSHASVVQDVSGAKNPTSDGNWSSTAAGPVCVLTMRMTSAGEDPLRGTGQPGGGLRSASTSTMDSLSPLTVNSAGATARTSSLGAAGCGPVPTRMNGAASIGCASICCECTAPWTR